jgi:hypothetical protein
VTTVFDRGRQILEHPELYPGLPQREYARVILRTWRYPSFEPYFSWAVVQAKGELFLRRVVWDQRRRDVPEPITFGSEVPLDSKEYSLLLDELQVIKVPPFLSVSTVGLDGTSYGVESGSYMLSARLAWWEAAPAAWAPLQQWHERAASAFESLLPLATTSIKDGAP